MLNVLLAEAEEFRAQAARFMAGDLEEEAFRTFRLRRGIYGQKQPGVQMVRVKIPSGIATAAQLRTIAEVAEEFGSGIGHLTTRQDVQIHFVPLARVADAIERLAYAGLSTREACGNSVRNVTACPLAGRCPGQAFNVLPFSLAISRRFMRNPLTARLPRKFKVAFSCSLEDCALGDINDVGVAALIRGGLHGFRLRVGGGLGPSPQLAQTLYEFVPVNRLGEVCDAILRVFDQHGNRQDRHRARLKFILREKGIAWFRQKVDEARVAHDSEPLQVPEEPPTPTGKAIWGVVPQGNISAEQFRRLAQLAEQYGDGTVRFTLNQNVVFTGVGAENTAELRRQLRGTGFRTEGAGELADVVTCPGAATCNLGLTRSMDLAAQLSRLLLAETDSLARRVTIRISGCPNSCGHHHVGQIGLYGNARKVGGQAAPFYQLLIGGGKQDGSMRFGKPVLSLPARFVPEAIQRILTLYKTQRLLAETFLEFVDRIGMERFRSLLGDLTGPASENTFVDWGEEEKFTLKLGRGECAT